MNSEIGIFSWKEKEKHRLEVLEHNQARKAKRTIQQQINILSRKRGSSVKEVTKLTKLLKETTDDVSREGT
tara:strand:+ start:301 stop:513 length:213 start_codon:yes stop_codon:yes gene_type:complete